MHPPTHSLTYSSPTSLSLHNRHYLLVIVGVYGPACHLLTPDPDSMSYSAGVNIRLLIQSCDINGQKCEQGGSLFQGTLTRRSEENETILAEEVFRARNITIDDDLDGRLAKCSYLFFSF